MPYFRGRNKPEDALTKPKSDETIYPEGLSLYLIITGLLLGPLLVAIDNTVIGTIIPKISSDFKALEDVAFYGSVYLLTVTALQPTFGVLYK